MFRLIGLLWSIENPKKKVLINCSVAFIILSFFYFVRWLSGIQIDLELEGTYTDELLFKGRIISAIKFYGVFLLFTYWQYRKWIKKGNDSVEVKDIAVERMGIKNVVHEKEKRKIDPDNASFKRNNLLEKFVRD